MTHHEDDKKKKIRERNKRNWMIFTLAEQQREKVDVGAAVTERKAEDGKKTAADIGMKMALIGNLINNGRRKSTERWNRYAGTSDGGGRGR